jgi:hypothetical protein
MAGFCKTFLLQTDASGQALAAVLLQEVEGGRKVVAYASQTLAAQEMKASSAYELECLAVVFALDKFRQYLKHQEFLLVTDNQALSWLLNHPRQVGKIGRWIVKISSFKVRVQHISGTQNVIADALSRMFQTGSEENDVACYNVLTKFPLVFEDLASVQIQDPELSQIIQKLEAGENCSPYSLHKSLLHCRSRCDGELKVVAPRYLWFFSFSTSPCLAVILVFLRLSIKHVQTSSGREWIMTSVLVYGLAAYVHLVTQRRHPSYAS